MVRAMLAMFVITPIVMSLPFGIFLPFALGVILTVICICVLPLFFLLRHFGWLEWWHALLAGAFCSMLVAHLLVGSSGAGYRSLDWPTTYIGLLAIGCFGAMLFWWLGVFRNDELPFVSREWPWTMLLLVPLAMGGWSYQRALAVESAHGCIVSMQAPSRPELWWYRDVEIRLPSGETVHANRAQSTKALVGTVGECARVSRRKTLTLGDYVYGTSYAASEDNCTELCTETRGR